MPALVCCAAAPVPPDPPTAGPPGVAAVPTWPGASDCALPVAPLPTTPPIVPDPPVLPETAPVDGADKLSPDAVPELAASLAAVVPLTVVPQPASATTATSPTKTRDLLISQSRP